MSELTDLAQKAAELYWAVATSNDLTVARYDTDAYRSAETTLKAILKAAYPGVPEQVLDAARDELAGLGPFDGDYRVSGKGIDSYVRAQLQETLDETAGRMTNDQLAHALANAAGARESQPIRGWLREAARRLQAVSVIGTRVRAVYDDADAPAIGQVVAWIDEESVMVRWPGGEVMATPADEITPA